MQIENENIKQLFTRYGMYNYMQVSALNAACNDWGWIKKFYSKTTSTKVQRTKDQIIA